MSSPRQAITTPELFENTTGRLQLQLTDQDDVAVLAVQTCTLTLYDRATGTILNGRDEQSIDGVNGGTIDTGGLLTLVLSPDDNVLANQERTEEDHVALIEWTWGTSGAGKKEITFLVLNQVKVSPSS